MELVERNGGRVERSGAGVSAGEVYGQTELKTANILSASATLGARSAR